MGPSRASQSLLHAQPGPLRRLSMRYHFQLRMPWRSRLVAASFVLLWAFFGWPTSRGEDPAAKEKQEGYVSLFNGKDFTGWRFSGGKSDSPADAPNWKVEGG